MPETQGMSLSRKLILAALILVPLSMTIGILIGSRRTDQDIHDSESKANADPITTAFSLFSQPDLKGEEVLALSSVVCSSNPPLDIQIAHGNNPHVLIQSAFIQKLEAGTSICFYDSDSDDAVPLMSISAPSLDIREPIEIADLFSGQSSYGNVSVYIAPGHHKQHPIKRARIYKSSRFLIL